MTLMRASRLNTLQGWNQAQRVRFGVLNLMQVSLSTPCLSMIPWQTGSIHFFPSFYKHWLGTYYASGIIPSAGHTIWNKTKFLFSWRLHSVGVTSQRVKVSRFPAPGQNDPKYTSDPAKKPHFFVCIQYMGLGVNNGQFCPPNHTPVSTRSPPVTLQNMRTLSEWVKWRCCGSKSTLMMKTGGRAGEGATPFLHFPPSLCPPNCKQRS